MRFTLKEIKDLFELVHKSDLPYFCYESLFFKGGYWRTPRGFRDSLKNFSDSYKEDFDSQSFAPPDNVFELTFETPLEDMPLYVNEDGIAEMIARWRMKWAK